MAKIQPHTQLLTSQNQPAYTTTPIAAVEPGAFREYLRLPKNRQVDPVFSLSRSTWNLLILPCATNNFKPPIKSISLRRPGTQRGVRLIVVESARGYFQRLVDEAEASADDHHDEANAE